MNAHTMRSGVAAALLGTVLGATISASTSLVLEHSRQKAEAQARFFDLRVEVYARLDDRVTRFGNYTHEATRDDMDQFMKDASLVMLIGSSDTITATTKMTGRVVDWWGSDRRRPLPREVATEFLMAARADLGLPVQ